MGWREKEDSKLENIRVLVVGAGGIGCELLKNIVLSGFKNIHVIDLDTIDVSNLNRQFLFRREHVGKSKAEVAVEAVQNLRPGVKIVFDHDSIFSEKFGLSFFKQFTFVMNALDNRAARNHVNRLCIAAEIPLIESGSSGYLGQVSVILRGRTECYECQDKPVQKTFPGCTIRNTPSEHIHCTVWAKHVFNQLFGEIDIDDDVSPDVNDDENTSDEPMDTNKENATDNGTVANGKVDKQPENTRLWAENVQYNPEKLFNKLFNEDIRYLLSMKNLWKERRPPVPMTLTDASTNSAGTSEIYAVPSDDINKVWSSAKCAEVFVECVNKLRVRKEKLTDGSILVWDKDDEDAMRFVGACANVRAVIFGIQPKTLFEIKSMAGNIIPAVATTNAIVAGAMVIEALKVVRGDWAAIRAPFLRLQPSARAKIVEDALPFEPNPLCFICGEKRECYIRVNPHEMTVKGLLDKVLKGALHMQQPDVMDISTPECRVLISSEEGETEINEPKKLSELHVGDGSLLDCDDYSQELKLKLIIQGTEDLKADDFEVLRDSGVTVKKESSEEDSRKRKPEPTELDENAGSNVKRICA